MTPPSFPEMSHPGPRLALVILGYRLRAFSRRVAADAFPLFVLGPLIAGGGLWVAGRYLALAGDALAALLGSGAAPGALGYGAALLLTGLALPGAQRELFPVRAAGGYLEALPVPESVRFHVALAACGSRQLPVCAVLLAALFVLRGGAASAAELGRWTWQLLAALAPLTLLAMVAALLRVRLGTLGPPGGGRLLAALAVLGGILALLPAAVRLRLLLPWRAAAAWLEGVLGQALAVPSPASGTGAAWAPTVAAVYGAAGWLFLRFRRRDLERAEHLFRSTAPDGLRPRLLRLGGRRSALRTQLTRDLLLIGRRFSPAVYLAAGLAVLALAASFLVVPGLGLGAPWPRRLGILGSLVAVLALVALVPLLLRYQLPRFWLDQSSGVAREEIWRAKVWLARVLALPGTLAGAALLGTLPGSGSAVAGLQLAAGAWILASVVGLAAFEIAEHPVLGLAFSALAGLALAVLFVIYPQVWWMWGTLYVVVAGKLGERASRRVKLMEVAP